MVGLRWAIGLLAGTVALITGLLLALPWLIDLPAVRAQVERQVSQAVNGSVTWSALDVRLFPMPRAVLEGARVAIPGVLDGTVDAVELELRLRPLVFGRAEISSVVIVRPVLRLTIPASKPAADAPAKSPIEIYRGIAEPLAQILRKIAPETTLSLRDGRLEVIAPGLPPIGATDMNLNVRTDGTGVALDGVMSGTYWDRVSINLRLDYADLKARAAADASGLKPQNVLDRLLAGVQPAVEIPTVGLHVKAGTDGRSSFDLAVSLDAPRTRVRRGERFVDVAEARVNAVAAMRGADIEVTLTDIHLGDMVPSARSTLRLVGANHQPQFSVEVDSVDLTRLRDAALAMLDDQPVIRDYVGRIRGGRVTDMRFAAASDTFATLFDWRNANAGLRLDGGTMLVPVIEQEVSGVGGKVELSGGALKVTSAEAKLGPSRVNGAAFELGLEDLHVDSQAAFALDLPQALAIIRPQLTQQQRASLAMIRSARGAAQGHASFALRDKQWSAKVAIVRSDAVVRVAQVPWPIALEQGRVEASPARVALSGLNGSAGPIVLSQGGGEISLGGPPSVRAGGARVAVAVDELYRWLRSQKALASSLQPITSIGGRATVTLSGVQGRLDKPEALAFDVSIEPHDIKVETAEWPAAAVDGGTIRITPDALLVERVGARVLDARAMLSARVDAYRSDKRRVDARVDAGLIGHGLIEWIWQRFQLPQPVVPATPISLAARRIQWRDGKLDVAAEARVDQGPAVGIDIAFARGALELRRLAIKDDASDATFSAATRGRLIDITFAGALASRSVAALLQYAARDYGGKLQGDLRVTLDRDLEGRAEAHGRVLAENINLARLLPVPLKLERADVEGAGRKLRVRELKVDLNEQKATLRGEIERRAYGASIRAEVESPGVVIDALLPAPKADAGSEVPPDTAADESPPPSIWPLRVTGTLAVRAGFLQWRTYRVEPVRADLVLEQERAQMNVSDANLCGIAFPFSLVAVPGEVDAAVVLSAQGQELTGVSRCFGQDKLVLTGTFDLNAKLRAKGNPKELIHALEGPVQLHARDGEIRKFALLGNILSLKSVTSVLKKGTKVSGEGFEYKKLDLRGTFGKGAFAVEEAALDSPALGLAANGSVDLTGDKSRLTVLVAPFGRIDRLVRKLPIVGYVFGGALTSIPVGVSGDIRSPLVVPLGPSAITSELTGIFARTLKLPTKLLPATGGGTLAQ